MPRRGQGAFEYLLLLGGVLLIVILALLILRGGVLTPANRQIAGSLGVLANLTNASAALATPTPTPAPNVAPTVVLNSPLNGATIPAGTVFRYTPSDDSGFGNATLFGNFTGAWATNASNATALVNNTLNNLSTTVAPGYYVWNVQACDNQGNCSFAPANFTLTVLASGTNVWTYTSNPTGILTTGDAESARGVAFDPAGFVWVAGYHMFTASFSGFWRLEKLNASTGANVLTYISDPNPGGTDAANAIAFDPSGFVYSAGFGSAGLGFNWHAEKVNATSGVNVWNYTSTPPADARARGVAFDSSGFLYVAGSEASGARWRVEKLYASNGSNLWSYTSDPTGAADEAFGVAFDPSGFLYIVGYDSGGGGKRWRVEKLYASNASNLWNYTSNPSGADDRAKSVAFDSSGFLYVAGLADVSGLSGGFMHVEKLNAASGANVWNYTTVAFKQTLLDLTLGVAFNPAGFVYLGGSDLRLAGTAGWRVEKLNASTGSNVWNYSGYYSGSPIFDGVQAMTLDSAGFLYAVGYQNWVGSGSDSLWRVEKIAG